MSKQLFNPKQESEIKREVHDLIKKGFSFPPIKVAIENKFDYVRDKNTSELVNFIENIVTNFEGYRFIQRVKKSKIIAPNNSKSWFLYDPVLKTKEYVLESNITKLCKFDWMANLVPCTLEYLPNTKEDIILNEDDTITFNTYLPAAWFKHFHYFGKAAESDVKVPSIYENFFNHLFKQDAQSITYVLDWMANAIKGKNQCYLTAISNQGTGKGTLGDIFKLLVGASNYVTMPFTSITKQFNSQLDEKKIIYFDEVKVKTREQQDILKILVNEFIEIERKNHDAKTAKNFASLYLSSNDLSSLKITGDDRRYSIVEMTDTKFNQVFTNDERLKLFLPENIYQLGVYLLNRPVDYDKMTVPFQSNRTKMVKAASLNDWEDAILNSIAVSQAGKKLTFLQLKDILFNELNKTVNIGNKALKDLESKFPNFFTFKREYQSDGRRIFTIEFLELATQPRQLLETIDVSFE